MSPLTFQSAIEGVSQVTLSYDDLDIDSIARTTKAATALTAGHLTVILIQFQCSLCDFVHESLHNAIHHTCFKDCATNIGTGIV